MAAERRAFETALLAVLEDSGLDEDDDALFDAWGAAQPGTGDDEENR